MYKGYRKYARLFALPAIGIVLLLTGCALKPEPETIQKEVLDCMNERYNDTFVVVDYSHSSSDSFGAFSRNASIEVMTGEEKKKGNYQDYNTIEVSYRIDEDGQRQIHDTAYRYYLDAEYDHAAEKIIDPYFPDSVFRADIKYLAKDVEFEKGMHLDTLPKSAEEGDNLYGDIEIYLSQEQGKDGTQIKDAIRAIRKELRENAAGLNDITVVVIGDSDFQKIRTMLAHKEERQVRDYVQENKNKILKIYYNNPDGSIEEEQV